MMKINFQTLFRPNIKTLLSTSCHRIKTVAVSSVHFQNYLNEPYFEFLQSMKLSHVFLQGYWMPPIFEVYGRFKDHIKRHTLIRLHGPDRKGIEKHTKNKWNAIVDPKDGELHKLKIMINDLLSREVLVTLNVNNHYEGSAPMTIDRFINLFLKGAFT